MADPVVRSVHRAGTGTLRMSLFYPADGADLADARLTGLVPPTVEQPLPLVVFLPGINVAPDSYRWLAVELTAAGHVVALPSIVDELGPAGTGISPGLDLTAMAPEVLGTRPSASALADVLALAVDDPLVGPAVDPTRIALGGHSAGGTVALHNADPAWFPGVGAVFAYGAHTMTATSLGHGEAAVTSIPSVTPVLLLAGANDGVIAASRDRYRSDDATHDPVRRTFDEAVTADRGDSWYVELADGTHFTICHPIDHTSGRSFLEPDDPAGQADARRCLAATLVRFLAVAFGTAEPTDLESALDAPAVRSWARS